VTRALDVVIVNGSPNAPSKSVAVARLVIEALDEIVHASTRLIDVYRLGDGLTSATAREGVSEAVELELQAIERADVIVTAVPVFRGSYPGMFKHLFDLVDQYALANKLVVLTATGGSERHALMIEHELRPLFGFFQSFVAPVGFFVSAGAIDGSTILDAEMHSRVRVGLRDVTPRLRELAEEKCSHAGRAAHTALSPSQGTR
jgi:FMN reductase